MNNMVSDSGLLRLKDEVALVTGGARGLGEADARMFVAEGANVVITDVLDQQGEALADELGPDATYIHLDVAVEDDWAAAVALTEEKFGPVSVLVNNAGIFNSAPIDEFEIADWQQIIGVDLTGVLLGMKHVTPGMKRLRRGSIINISSIMGLRGAAHCYGYTAAKWGVRGLTKCAAIELGGFGIRVNTVLPGFTETPMTDDQDFTTLEIPLRRSSAPSEQADVVLFLASDASAFMTGAELDVNGGQHLPMGRYDQIHGVQLTGPVEELV